MRAPLLTLALAGCSFSVIAPGTGADGGPDTPLATDAPPGVDACVSFAAQLDSCTLPASSDLTLSGTVVLDTDAGTLVDGTGAAIPATLVAVATSPGGVSVMVLVADDLTLGATTRLRATGSRPLALVARGTLRFDGNAFLDVGDGGAGARTGCTSGAGAGASAGAVAGLVAITPAAGFVSLAGALAIGTGAAVICYFAVFFVKQKLGYDDALDAFGVHGIGGIWGAIATGIFATTSVNSGGANGLLYGNPGLLWIQIKVVIITMIFSFAGSFILLKLVDKVMGLRVSDHEERIGLDLSEHREAAYTILE